MSTYNAVSGSDPRPLPLPDLCFLRFKGAGEGAEGALRVL